MSAEPQASSLAVAARAGETVFLSGTGYRVALPETWTDEEQASLEATLLEFPATQHSVATQCAQAAARLPNKSIRDVGARLRNMPQPQPDDDDVSRRIDDILRANMEVIGKMRDNLHKIDLLENIPLMGEFDRNVAGAFALLRKLNAKMPPFPVRVNTMYLANGHASNASADAFDEVSGVAPATTDQQAYQPAPATSSSSEQLAHPPNIQIPPV